MGTEWTNRERDRETETGTETERQTERKRVQVERERLKGGKGVAPPLSSDYEGATRWAPREWGDEIRFALATISRRASQSK